MGNEQLSQRPTTNDLARAAGVSLATVDRVLNERPGVRKSTIERVHEAITRIGYVRDVSAANLARQRTYHLVIVLPDGAAQFQQALREAVRASSEDAKVERTFVQLLSVPVQDPHVLVEALNDLNCESVDGVAIMAPETPHVRDAIRRLKDGGVAVVSIVSDLPNTDRDYFIGIDNFAAGRTAAVLVGRFLDPGKCKVLVLASSMLLRDSAERRLGFDEVMQQRFPDVTVLPSLEGHDDAEKLSQLLGAALDKNDDIKAVYAVGSGNQVLTRVIEERGMTDDLVVVAHEMTPHNKLALANRTVDAVITQNVGHMIRSSLRVLRAKSDRSEINSAQERIRIEIVLRENMM